MLRTSEAAINTINTSKGDSRRFYEFADIKGYKPSTDDIAAVTKQTKRIWRNYGVDADAPLIHRIKDDRVVEKSELIDACAK